MTVVDEGFAVPAGDVLVGAAAGTAVHLKGIDAGAAGGGEGAAEVGLLRDPVFDLDFGRDDPHVGEGIGLEWRGRGRGAFRVLVEQIGEELDLQLVPHYRCRHVKVLPISQWPPSVNASMSYGRSESPGRYTWALWDVGETVKPLPWGRGFSSEWCS
ncbi:hypothetical protein [Streptomyces fungicidicus]|uniref:hypothetical protein n=1 Tax=Streptomyces fungicidicus TaxID=68203 RepID=UPI0036C61E35